MTDPLISIIVCCYNRADMLPQTLDSVFSQNYRPVEIIVHDDGSTDGTAEMMKQYQHRVAYFRQTNQGITASRTNACLHASGEYIAFVDDDDLMPPNRLTTLYGALKQFPEAVFSTGDFEVIDEQGQPTGKRWLPQQADKPRTPVLISNGQEAVLWPRTATTVHTSLFRRTDGEKIGWFDSNYQYASEDKDFFARLGLLGPVAYVPEVVSCYRRGHASLTTSSLTVLIEQLLLFSSHLPHITDEHLEFRRRLQSRIVRTLVAISRHRSEASRLSDTVIRKRIAAALAQLTWTDKIKYHARRWLAQPLKRWAGRGSRPLDSD